MLVFLLNERLLLVVFFSNFTFIRDFGKSLDSLSLLESESIDLVVLGGESHNGDE